MSVTPNLMKAEHKDYKMGVLGDTLERLRSTYTASIPAMCMDEK